MTKRVLTETGIADDVACARSIWCRIVGENDPADAVRKAA